jgi:hypothetical protein
VNDGSYSLISSTEVDNIIVNIGDTIYVRTAETTSKPASEVQQITVGPDDISPSGE